MGFPLNSYKISLLICTEITNKYLSTRIYVKTYYIIDMLEIDLMI